MCLGESSYISRFYWICLVADATGQETVKKNLVVKAADLWSRVERIRSGRLSFHCKLVAVSLALSILITFARFSFIREGPQLVCLGLDLQSLASYRSLVLISHAVG